MYRVSNGTQAASLPTPAAVSGTPGFFTPGIPGTTPATIVDQDWANMVQEELYALVVAGGMTPDKTNNAQVLASLRALFAAASTVSTKSAAYTITTSDNGALIVAGAYAMTLPSAPATAFRVTILSSATGTTILPNGNTVNLASGATSSTISLPVAGDFVTLVWDGSVWRVVGGSAAMLNAAPLAGSTTQQFNVAAATSSANAVNLGQFPNSIGSSGYQKLPNGLILQWGYIAATNGTFNFPIAFPNAGLSFFACNSNSQGTLVDNAYGYIVSNTQFFIATKNSGADSISNYPCTWLALGN